MTIVTPSAKNSDQRLVLTGTIRAALIVWVLLGGALGPATAFELSGNFPAKVIDPPVIDEQPVGRVATEGGPVALSILAHSPKLLKYQWWKNGQPLTNTARLIGATNAVLSLDPLQPADSGSYAAVVTSSGGSVTSSAVSMVVSQLLFQVAPLGSTGALVTVLGQPGDVYRIEVSVNFGPWLTNGYTTNYSGRATFLDNASGGGFRNLRARFERLLPVLSGPRRPDRFMRAYGQFNQVWTLQGSENLQQWESLRTLTNLVGSTLLVDNSGVLPTNRFYRIAVP